MLALFLFFFISCDKQGMLFKVENKSKKTIDSIIISNGYDVVKIERLSKNQLKEVYLKFIKEKPKSDGSFFIKVFPNSIRKDFGYYSNGFIPTYKYYISLEKDSIVIKEFSN